MRRALFAVLIPLALAACGDPPPPQPAPAAAAASAPAVQQPMPAMADWVAPYLGKKLKEAFPSTKEQCVGFVDSVDKRFGGDKPGVQIGGWGWSMTESRAYAHVVAVDESGVIVGGGESGIPRGDVRAAMKAVTEEKVGYIALSTQTSGMAEAYGVNKAGDAACRLGPGIRL